MFGMFPVGCVGGEKTKKKKYFGFGCTRLKCIKLTRVYFLGKYGGKKLILFNLFTNEDDVNEKTKSSLGGNLSNAQNLTFAHHIVVFTFDSENRKQQATQPGNRQPSERTEGEKMTVIWWGRGRMLTSVGLFREFSDFPGAVVP